MTSNSVTSCFQSWLDGKYGFNLEPHPNPHIDNPCCDTVHSVAVVVGLVRMPDFDLKDVRPYEEHRVISSMSPNCISVDDIHSQVDLILKVGPLEVSQPTESAADIRDARPASC